MTHWSRTSPFVVVTAVLGFGGFLLGKSSSDDKNEERRGAEGRFQMIVTPATNFIVFDTRTARGWFLTSSNWPNPEIGEWQPISSPFVPKQLPEGVLDLDLQRKAKANVQAARASAQAARERAEREAAARAEQERLKAFEKEAARAEQEQDE
jgi:hypothetical protein